ncbi:MAG TPA: S8 family serine peptidase [Blastocatellia bacterium]
MSKKLRPVVSPPSKSKKSRSGKIMLFLLPSVLTCLCLLAVTVAGVFSNRIPKADAAAQMQNGISPEAMAQIEALIREKDSRTGVQMKMDSQLIYEVKMRNGQAVAEGVQAVETDLPYNDMGKVELDIKAIVDDSLLNQLRANGAQIVSSVPSEKSVRVSVDIDRVEALAALPDVAFVQPKQDAITSQVERPIDDTRPAKGALGSSTKKHDLPVDFANRAAKVRGFVTASLAGDAQGNVAGSFPPTGVGSRSSEGDTTHRAFTARGAFHVNGTGIKIGVLSDGVTNLAASQAAGDLGPVTVLPGQAGSGDEGTAMLEIIHDLAPGAQLYFATAFTSIASFAQNIRNLRAAGCDIIVDDVFYFVETPFQDGQAPSVVSNTNGGVVIQAVNDVTASGAMYFSSAGNSGNLNDGTAGVWEGDFADGGATGAPLPAGRFHNFGGQNFNTLTVASTGPINLYWADPLGGASNDYDLFRLNAAGTAVAASSTNIQNGTQDPYEQISQSITNPRIVIVKKTGSADRFLHLNTNRGRLSIATAGQTHGHAAAAAAFGCAATPAVGPFPNPFSAANAVETFSSDGPRRIFFQPDGTPITAGNFSSTGGLLRQKPDITGADGVSVTGVGGFPSPFFGTSAAAPHAAAIAGLIKSANPAFTPAQIRAFLTSTAIDNEAPGVDRDSGAGIIDTLAALQASGAPGTAFLEFGSITASENPGDGNGSIDAGDGASLIVQLKNTGVANATAISATLASSSPGVIITLPNTSAYPGLAALGGSGVNVTPFRFTVASNVQCPARLDFTLIVNYTGGVSPQVLSFSIPSGPTPISIASVLDTTTPTPGAGFTTTTGTVGVRHFRDGIPSSCGPAKAFPGTTQPGTRQFDAYAFTTCSNSAASCVTVTLSGANAINLFTAAYSGSFNPADISQNFLADAGASAATRTYSFSVPAGQQTFVVIVYDVPPGLATPSGSTYTLNVSGGCIGACTTPNQVPVAKCKNVTVSAGGDCTANASINDGSFDPDGDSLTITQSPAGPYPKGSTPVLLTVSDPRGATTQCTSTVTVVDTTPPTIACPGNIVRNTDPGLCSAVVTYANPTVGDNCPGVGTPTCTPPSGSVFPKGTTTVNCSVTDAAPLTSTCSFTVKVEDHEAPVVTSNVTTTTLWIPDHTLRNVGLTASATDNCDSNLTLVVRVYGDENDEEPTEDGNFSPDARNIGVGTLRLRSERNGARDGRVYLVVVTATDSSGNVGRSSKTVTVALSQGSAEMQSVANQAAAAKTFFDQFGTPPAGYFVIGDGPIIGPKQ